MHITCCETYSIHTIYPLSFWEENKEVHSFDLSCTQNYIFGHHFTPLSNSCVGIKVKAHILLSIPYLFLFSLFPNVRKVFSFLSLPLPSTVAKHGLKEPLKRECQNSKLFCEKKTKNQKDQKQITKSSHWSLTSRSPLLLIHGGSHISNTRRTDRKSVV